jgi:phosphatidate cytidylyltransferase
MIRTRVLVGSLLALGAAGVLVGDTLLAQRGFAWFPCLLAGVLFMGVVAARELVQLLPEATRPSRVVVTSGVLLALLANWLPAARVALGGQPPSPWALLAVASAGALMGALLVEMRAFGGAVGVAVPRAALAAFAVGYLGLLPCFFVQVRWLTLDTTASATMLALVVFVPKCNDIGAFFTGTFLGKHKMTPVLSPKKTWEGFAGGTVGGALAALALAQVANVFPFGAVEALTFGVVVGWAGVLGDLAESLIKRDCGTKDASKSIPGFGGLLDVIDSVLFAAPVAYLWFLARAT